MVKKLYFKALFYNEHETILMWIVDPILLEENKSPSYFLVFPSNVCENYYYSHFLKEVDNNSATTFSSNSRGCTGSMQTIM